MQIRSAAAEQAAANVKLARERLAALEAVLAPYAGSADAAHDGRTEV